jgi:hypothetical protein
MIAGSSRGYLEAGKAKTEMKLHKCEGNTTTARRSAASIYNDPASGWRRLT